MTSASDKEMVNVLGDRGNLKRALTSPRGSAARCCLPFAVSTLPAALVMTSAGMPATPNAAGSASRASLADHGTANALADDKDARVRA